ncbi:hypothetical protein EDD11_003812 [Mortierella claussenii]|nr:hypothetical protein EDD11_003812 [Mortierella claussenii]
MSSSSSSSSAAAGKAAASKRPSDQELTQTYNAMKSELNQLAQKIGELETEADEHTLVVDTITPLDPERKCFRLVGGVLVERTVKEVLPALKTNQEGIKNVTMQLVQKYKAKEDEFMAYQKKYNIQRAIDIHLIPPKSLQPQQEGSSAFMAILNIKWGREKKTFEFPDRSLADIRLGELRQQCHEWTRVPIGGLTLIYAGATMKDDHAPLSCFGIKPNGQITMMGTRPTKTDIRTLTTNGDPEEYSLIVRIQTSLQKAMEMAAEHLPRYQQAVDDYIRGSHSNNAVAPTSSSVPTKKNLQDAYTLLSEHLTQALLVFDGVVCKQNFEVARGTRREAVKETQRLLDIIDDLNERVRVHDRLS